MKFVNREEELNIIKESLKLSERKLYTLLITGARRIGKTRLILEVLRENDIYFFVNKDKIPSKLLEEYEEILKAKNILKELEHIKSWDDFLKVLFKRVKGIVVFDEFQNFKDVDSSIYGLFQKYIDLNENRKDLLLIFSGSNISLIKKTFEDKKSPLYGRIKRKLALRPLKLKDTFKFCKVLNIKKVEDVFILYLIFGGYPKYYVCIEDENLKKKSIKAILDRFFFQENALLEDEVANILSLEFGKRRGIYYEILSALSQGNTQLKDISSFLNKKQTSLSRQFNGLLNYFNIIDFRVIFPKNKKIYYIKHPLINFWFKFFYKNLSLYTQKIPYFFEYFKNQFNTFLGRRFEILCEELLEEFNFKKILPFYLEEIGTYIGYKRENGKRESYDIDIVGINRKEKKVLFCECKWKDRINPLKILKELYDKSQIKEFSSYKKYFLIFAKSFVYKTDKLICMDLKDILQTLQIRYI